MSFKLTIKDSRDEAQVQIFLPQEALGLVASVLDWWLVLFRRCENVGTRWAWRSRLVHAWVVADSGRIPNCGPWGLLLVDPLRIGGWGVFCCSERVLQ